MEATEPRSEARRGRNTHPVGKGRGQVRGGPGITDHQSQKGPQQEWPLSPQSGVQTAGPERGSDRTRTKPILLPKWTGELSTKIHSLLLLLGRLVSRKTLGLFFLTHKVPHQKSGGGFWMPPQVEHPTLGTSSASCKSHHCSKGTRSRSQPDIVPPRRSKA